MREDLVIASTTTKLINKAKATGTLNMSVLSLLNLLAKRITYLTGLQQTQENVDKLVTLKNKFAQTMYQCTDVCNYKVAINLLCKSDEDLSVFLNSPPTVSGKTQSFEGTSYSFSYSDFTVNFNDIDPGDRPKYVKIVSLPATGEIKYMGASIPVGYTFDLEDVSNLTYEVTGATASDTRFTFQTSDDNATPLFSNEAEYVFDLDNQTSNMPATIGDYDMEVDKNTTTPLTLEMFVSQTTPPYNDPEDDLIDAIRIDRLHSTNKGVFAFDGVSVVNGQIITREEIEAGRFTHISFNGEGVATDGFEFSARDEGSGIWVN
jgi:hypothetical protein